MKEKTGRILRLIYALLFSLLAVFIGVICIMQAWSIYKTADYEAYTRARVWEHFKEIAIPIAIFIGAFFGNIAIALAYPKKKEKLKAEIDPAITAGRLREKAGNVKGAKKERFYRGILNVLIAAIVLFGLTLCVGIMYVDSYTPMLSAEFFLKNDCMVDRLIRVAIYAISGLLVCAILVALKSISLNKEIGLYKAELVVRAKGLSHQGWVAVAEKVALAKWQEGKKCAKVLDGAKADAKILLKQQAKAKRKKSKKVDKNGSQAWVWSVRIALFAVAIVFIASGVTNGGLHAVFKKAINVCTQCIGIG